MSLSDKVLEQFGTKKKKTKITIKPHPKDVEADPKVVADMKKRLAAAKKNEAEEKKHLDWEGTQDGIDFEIYQYGNTDVYEIWLYLKQGKTLVSKKDMGAYGPKNTLFDMIDKYIKKGQKPKGPHKPDRSER